MLTSARPRAPHVVRRALTLLTVVGACSALASCAGAAHLDATSAVEKYDRVTDDVATSISEGVPSLVEDGSSPAIDGTGGCRVTAVSYASADLVDESTTAEVDSQRVVTAADAALAEHGFSALALDAEYPKPMQTFVATDDTGGSIRVVIESRPGRPTVRVWWSAQVDTQDQPCDERLLH